MIYFTRRRCPTCGITFHCHRHSDLFRCPHCGHDTMLPLSYVVSLLLLCWGGGFSLAIPEYGNTRTFLFAGLSCGFLAALVSFSLLSVSLSRTRPAGSIRSRTRK